MRFLVDVCAGKAITQWLEDKEYNVLSVADRDPRMSDSEILAWSINENRILVTLDKDFPEKELMDGSIVTVKPGKIRITKR